MAKRWTEPALAMGLLIGACADSRPPDQTPLHAQNLQSAEALIDAFYSFDPDKLRPLLAAAEDSGPKLMFYQGWAEGANYRIVDRKPCAARTAGTIDCAITVEDDPVLALNTGFHVTDTFSIQFKGSEIVAVDTSSNDQQIYYDALNWVIEKMPEVMSGPCQGFFDGGPTPSDCARAMTEGYRKFAASDAYPGRSK